MMRQGRSLGSSKILYLGVAVTVLALFARLVLELDDAKKSRQTHVKTYKHVIVSGELTTWLRPLKDILAERHIDKPQNISILVIKSKRILRLSVNGAVVKTYVVGLGGDPVSRKTREGDYATPEGDYYVTGRGDDQYCRYLAISYPNARDASRGLHAGLINEDQYEKIVGAARRKATTPQHTALGGRVALHGGGCGLLRPIKHPREVRVYDWTQGCIALRRCDIIELYDFVPDGTPVRIEP